MNERITKLREQSINAKPYITPERAILITKFYKSDIAIKFLLQLEEHLPLNIFLKTKKSV